MSRRKPPISFTEMPSLFDELDCLTSTPNKKAEPGSIEERIGQEARRIARERSQSVIDPVKFNSQAEPIRFISFGSGSSGNCAYIGDSEGGFLIDAGVDSNRVEKTLRDNGINFRQVMGICLTHDHSDHVRYVYSLLKGSKQFSLYCTQKTLNGILRRHNLSRRIKDYHKPVFKEFAFTIGNFEITPFDVSHDGTDNAGFYITHSSGRHAFCVATDLGCITERVNHYMRQADYIMIESNYDLRMLIDGSYPEYLKRRIAAECGHLDNAVTAKYLSDIYTERLRYVFLCHLSQDNNTPAKALETVGNALSTVVRDGLVGDGSGSPQALLADIQLVALPRFDASPLFVLQPTFNN